jgi:hypothetical protein
MYLIFSSELTSYNLYYKKQKWLEKIQPLKIFLTLRLRWCYVSNTNPYGIYFHYMKVNGSSKSRVSYAKNFVLRSVVDFFSELTSYNHTMCM